MTRKIYKFAAIALLLVLCSCEKHTEFKNIAGEYIGQMEYSIGEGELRQQVISLILTRNGNYTVRYLYLGGATTSHKYMVEGNEIIFRYDDPMLRTSWYVGTLMGAYEFHLDEGVLLMERYNQSVRLERKR